MHFVKIRNNKIIFAEANKFAGYLFVCFDDNTIFLAKRSKLESDPDLWEGLGGHLDANETTEQAAKREVTEEAGSMPECIVIKTIVNKKENSIYTMYIAKLTADQKKNWKPKINKEHQDMKWLSKLPEPLHPELKKELSMLVNS